MKKLPIAIVVAALIAAATVLEINKISADGLWVLVVLALVAFCSSC